MSWLKGKKTHFLAAALIVYEVLGYFLGKSPEIDVKTILAALGLSALRAGVSKAGNGP